MKTILLTLILFLLVAPTFAQQPHVDSIIRTYDVDSDGLLTQEEVAKSSRYSRQFRRWDTDKDGKVSKEDIVAFRAKFGIAADGSSLKDEPKHSEPSPSSTKEFSVPDIASLVRVNKQTKLSRNLAANSQYLLDVSSHQVSGKNYFILTDHRDDAYLEPLGRLAKHHDGNIIRVNDLAVLHKNSNEFNRIRTKLIRGRAKFVAVAPRMESFRENMLLGMWELLSTLDTDPQLDCFPGILLASYQNSFSQLIDQSISHVPISNLKLKPFLVSQVANSTETRSLQKSGILREHFRSADIDSPIAAIYGKTATAAPKLKGEHVWNLTLESKRQFIKNPGSEVEAAFQNSNLIVMHGHGIPGMSCSLDVDALPIDLRGKILLSGSCFSASPKQSDLAAMREAPGGYKVEPRDAFVIRAIDNGTLVAFGHQRLSSGFPHLYPVLENWIEGQTVGQAYQQLINGLIDWGDFKSGEFIIPDSQTNQKRVKQNRLLYVVIGDPALQPFERFSELIE